MGIGTNIMLTMICINIFLAVGFPDNFNATEAIENLDDIGIDVSLDNSSYNQTYHINMTDVNATDATEMLGIEQAAAGGVFSSVSSFIAQIVQTTVGFMVWILKFLYAPITIMNQFPNAAYLTLVKVLFAVLYTVGYFIAIFQAWTGHEF